MEESKRACLEDKMQELYDECMETYSKKNRDYDGAFDKSLDEDGLVVAKIRMNDKILRFQSLMTNPAMVKDESMKDTLMDLANYALMTVRWINEIGESI